MKFIKLLSSMLHFVSPGLEVSVDPDPIEEAPGINSHLKDEIEFFKTFDTEAKWAYLNYRGRCERNDVTPISILQWKLEYDAWRIYLLSQETNTKGKRYDVDPLDVDPLFDRPQENDEAVMPINLASHLPERPVSLSDNEPSYLDRSAHL